MKYVNVLGQSGFTCCNSFVNRQSQRSVKMDNGKVMARPGRASAAKVEGPGLIPRPRPVRHFSIEWWLSVAKVQGSIPSRAIIFPLNGG